MAGVDEEIKLQLEAQRKELEQREKELEEREAQIENKRRKLDSENEEKVELQKRIVELENKLAAKLLEMQRGGLFMGQKQAEFGYLKALNQHHLIVQKQKSNDELQQVRNELIKVRYLLRVEKEELRKRIIELQKKLVEIGALKALNQNLIGEKQKSNDELQQVRKELIHFMKDMSSETSIGVKKMGKLDCKPFHNETKKKYSGDEADDKAIEFWSLWEDNLRDQSWHPFKMQRVEGGTKVVQVVDEKDEKLKDLKNEFGDEVYFAVRTALMEMIEYKTIGISEEVSELWNFKEGRKATVKEGVSYALKRWRLLLPSRN